MKNKKQVRRGKEPDHRRLSNQQRSVELGYARAHRGPRDAYAQHGQDTDEENEGQTDPVHSHLVRNVPLGNPIRRLRELQSAGGLVEPPIERGRDGKRGQRRSQGNPTREPLAAKQQNRGRTQKRQKGYRRQHGVIYHRAIVARASITKAKAPAAMISP